MPEFEELEIFRTILDGLTAGVYLVDRDRKIRFWNQGAEAITGYHHHDVIGHLTRENLLAGCDGASCALCGAACPLTEVMQDGKLRETQVFLRHKAGQRIPVRLRVFPIRNFHGSIVCTGVSFEENLWTSEMAFHQNNLAAHGCLDVLTGTPNHAFTQSHLRENLAFFSEYDLPFGILAIQVERLAELQATHGRESVDVMLHVVAETMKHTLRPEGILGRWAENQFLAIVTNCNKEELERLGQSLRKMAGSSGIQWWDDRLSVTVSVGPAMVQLGDTVETLLERAFCVLPAVLPGRAAAATASSDSSPDGPKN